MPNPGVVRAIIRSCVTQTLYLSHLEPYFKKKAYCVYVLVYLIISLLQVSLVYLLWQLDAEQFCLFNPVTLLCISISPIYSKPVS